MGFWGRFLNFRAGENLKIEEMGQILVGRIALENLYPNFPAKTGRQLQNNVFQRLKKFGPGIMGFWGRLLNFRAGENLKIEEMVENGPDSGGSNRDSKL